MRDDLDDLAVGMAGRADGVEFGLAHLSGMLDQRAGEGERGFRLGVRRTAVAVRQHLLIVEAGLAADGRVRRDAILAGVLFGDGQRDALPRFWVEKTRAGDPVDAEERVQRRRGIGQHADESWDHAKAGLDGVQQFFGFASGGCGVDDGNSSHEVNPCFVVGAARLGAAPPDNGGLLFL